MNLISYSDISKLFLSPLSDPAFQNFLSTHFDDLSEYNVSKSDYMVSKSTLVEFGFTNPDAVYDDDEQEVFGKGNPFFSHFNLFPQSRVKCTNYLMELNSAIKEKRCI